MKEIEFNKSGEKLWVNIEMTGLYFITYTFHVWAATVLEPPVITHPVKSGTNESPHDDHYCVLNDFVPNEPVANHHKRVIDVRFWVKKATADDGYVLKVTLLQGATYQTAQPLGDERISGTVAALSVKQEFITIKLIAN